MIKKILLVFFILFLLGTVHSQNNQEYYDIEEKDYQYDYNHEYDYNYAYPVQKVRSEDEHWKIEETILSEIIWIGFWVSLFLIAVLAIIFFLATTEFNIILIIILSITLVILCSPIVKKKQSKKDKKTIKYLKIFILVAIICLITLFFLGVFLKSLVQAILF